MKNRIGFMQGRLSPLVDGKIQAFPAQHWREEFPIANKMELYLMEWTLDQKDLYENPFMTASGQQEIQALCRQYNLSIPSLTGDCFMQAPFFKEGQDRASMLKDFENIVQACAVLGTKYIVFPLVDNSSLKTEKEEKDLLSDLMERTSLLEKTGVKIVFESDFPPERLKKFIAQYPTPYFGINYDMGNSASLGFDPEKEISAYADRILNVHVKDRILGGTTVPLGQGSANFDKIFSALGRVRYNGNYILQTARAKDDQHEKCLQQFVHFTQEKIDQWN